MYFGPWSIVQVVVIYVNNRKKAWKYGFFPYSIIEMEYDH